VNRSWLGCGEAAGWFHRSEVVAGPLLILSFPFSRKAKQSINRPIPTTVITEHIRHPDIPSTVRDPLSESHTTSWMSSAAGADDGGDDESFNLKVKIAAIFSLLAVALVGGVLPVYSRRARESPRFLAIANCFAGRNNKAHCLLLRSFHCPISIYLSIFAFSSPPMGIMRFRPLVPDKAATRNVTSSLTQLRSQFFLFE